MTIVLLAVAAIILAVILLGGSKSRRQPYPDWNHPHSQPWSSQPLSSPYRPAPKRASRQSQPRSSRHPSPAPRPASGQSGGRVFSVINPEGEIYSINTGDRNSPFFGPAWTHILEAHEKGECFRGKAVKRSLGRTDGAFHGYFIDIEGVRAFLPVSKAAWFYNPEHDACGKVLALTLEAIYPNGPKTGNLTVNAYAPLKHVLFSQSQEDFRPNATPWALAMDYDAKSLIFPHVKNKVIRVPLHEASQLAQRKGIGGGDCGSLMGRFWQLRVQRWMSGGVCVAHPVDVMSE